MKKTLVIGAGIATLGLVALLNQEGIKEKVKNTFFKSKPMQEFTFTNPRLRFQDDPKYAAKIKKRPAYIETEKKLKEWRERIPKIAPKIWAFYQEYLKIEKERGEIEAHTFSLKFFELEKKPEYIAEAKNLKTLEIEIDEYTLNLEKIDKEVYSIKSSELDRLAENLSHLRCYGYFGRYLL